MIVSLQARATGPQARQDSKGKNQRAHTPHQSPHAPKTPWERLKNSHLIVDRNTGDCFSLNSEQVQKAGLLPGKWIPLPKEQADAPTVEYLSPLKHFRLCAQKIGPVSGKDPVDLSISLDENDENGRFQVIF
ncbi:hypothetical protein [Vampirovibrio chlorellavorus]|uniref:hypothetical protein n=1 Tax=Vampirovibrio chlorellavorus TaxID=758823 RepID=UPI0026ECCAD9|nr:hypothetical protein [Vampirovibrio chlorellavorus]